MEAFGVPVFAPNRNTASTSSEAASSVLSMIAMSIEGVVCLATVPPMIGNCSVAPLEIRFPNGGFATIRSGCSFARASWYSRDAASWEVAVWS